eukprot:5428779-Amphidinium_carterae.1
MMTYGLQCILRTAAAAAIATSLSLVRALTPRRDLEFGVCRQVYVSGQGVAQEVQVSKLLSRSVVGCARCGRSEPAARTAVQVGTQLTEQAMSERCQIITVQYCLLRAMILLVRAVPLAGASYDRGGECCPPHWQESNESNACCPQPSR